MSAFLEMFKDPEAVRRYAENPPRYMPGYADMQRMAAVLLAEYAGPDARVLVLGAGGGLELRTFAELEPNWGMTGVDPSGEMLTLAAATLGPLADSVEMVEGYVDDAPPGPFDAAACLLTLHFLDRAERLRTLREIRARLKPGAPFVAAHSSFPQDPGARETWLRRYSAFAVTMGADPKEAERSRQAVGDNLSLLSPEEDAALMREAGFCDVELFYAAFTWRGWIGLA